MKELKKALPLNLFKDNATTANSLGGLPNNGTKLIQLLSEAAQSNLGRLNFMLFDEMVADNNGLQVNGTQLTNKEVAVVTVNTSNSAVVLPEAQPMLTITIANISEGKDLLVFPQVEAKIYGVTNSSILVSGKETAKFLALNNNNWIKL